MRDLVLGNGPLALIGARIRGELSSIARSHLVGELNPLGDDVVWVDLNTVSEAVPKIKAGRVPALTWRESDMMADFHQFLV